VFKNRSVIEVMVLTFTFVVGFSIIALGLMIVWVEIDNPSADTDRLVGTVSSLISSILGALLGLIAGRASAGAPIEGRDDLHDRPDGNTNGIGPSS
jgi:hypothetical protein